MAKYFSDLSSNRAQSQRHPNQHTQTSTLASCYSVDAMTSTVTSFHYCTTPGAVQEHSGIPEVRSGLKSHLSPSLHASDRRSSTPDNGRLEHSGEATHAIAGECERLFCEVLSAMFLGERNTARQESPVMDAYQLSRSDYTRQERRKQVQKWIELWDYASDTIYRGFVTDMGNEQTLFVFFEDGVFAHSLKSGLMALFELASMSAFGCSQIVACVRRLQDAIELDAVRSLGWCGFSLTTLEPFNTCGDQGTSLSNQWLFLIAEV